MNPEAKLTIYYDGLCHLCSREIEHYRQRMNRIPHPETVSFVDITLPDFNPVQEGIDPEMVHRTMHVKENNQIITGVDAFLTIWRYIPGYRWLYHIVRLPILYTLSKMSYALFARIRPLLPKKVRKSCDSGICNP